MSQQKQIKKPHPKKPSREVDTRTPSGKKLPY